MTNKKILIAIAVACFYAILIRCNSKTGNFVFKNKLSQNYSYKKISFSELIKSDSFYNDQYIEVKGIFHNSMEEQSLNSPTDSDRGVKNSFWISFELDSPLIEIKSKKELLGNGYFLNYLSGKPITIKGKLNLQKKGHLGQYRGTIEGITYLSARK